jgi:hypothetical protein
VERTARALQTAWYELLAADWLQLHQRKARRTAGRKSPARSRLKDLDPQVLTIAP